MDVTIREYGSEDRDAVIQIWNEVFSDGTPHNDPSLSLKRKVGMGDGLLLLAQKDGKVVGTVMGGYDGHRGWIYSLAVLPDYRRNGIATKLLGEMQKKLSELGSPKINLQVREDNAGVIEFYRKCGFEVERRVSMGKKLY
ncbi:MAG: GNAT family acetyltransferase [Chitinispirillaceae bacterium]